MINEQFVILFSLLSLGFFGGFTHCVGMCGPFVVAQVSNKMQKTKIEDYTIFKKLQNQALLPYHCGRVVTYSFLGLISGFLSEKINKLSFFNYFAAILMFFAAITFANYLFDQKISKFLSLKLKISKFLKFGFIKKIISLIIPKQLISKLFKNPTGYNGFLLGIMLGFIPCGMIYSAVALSLTMTNSFLAMLGMAIFATATIPALFVTGSASYFFIEQANFKLISKVIMFINIVLLLLFAFKLIY